jgi:hypothetical protein
LKLIDDWQRMLRRAWSVRFSLIATILGAVEVAVQLWAPGQGGKAAALAALASLAAGVSRIVAQPKMHQEGQQ